MAEIIDGQRIAEEIYRELRPKVDELKRLGITPKLATILIGEDAASLSYLRKIQESSGLIGVSVELIKLPENAGQEQVERTIAEVNEDSKVHGILLQMPLPRHLNADRLCEMISPLKDVDCVNPLNLGLLLLGTPRFIPCTALAVYEVLKRIGCDVRGREVTIVGAAGRVGRIISLLLIRNWATVISCDIATRDLSEFTRRGEVVISAVGRPRLITGDMVREGVIAIDVGVSRIKDPETGKTRLVGDFDFESVKQKAAAITPVPGGVGPVTTAMLMSNTIKAAEILINPIS